MAKRKAETEGMVKPMSVEPEANDNGMTVISVKMTKRFRDWLAGLADHDRSTIVQVMEKGSIAYAKQIGFADSAPKRTEGR